VQAPIATVAFGWQVSGERCPASVWSMRLTNADKQNVVLALGEVDERGGPTYHPDSIVVIFDEEAAHEYVTQASIGSAWGGAL